jgi:hypothetical protein
MESTTTTLAHSEILLPLLTRLTASVAEVSLDLFLLLTATGVLAWLGTFDRDVRTDLRIEGSDDIVVIGREAYMWSMLATRLLFVAFFAGIGLLTFLAPSLNAPSAVIAVFLAGLYALTGIRQLHLAAGGLRRAQVSLTSVAAVVAIASGTANLNDHGVFAAPLALLRRLLGT